MATNKGKSRKSNHSLGPSIEIGGNVDTGGGDIAAGRISKENVTIYRNSKVKTSTINNLFEPIYEKINDLPIIPPKDRQFLHKNVEEIQSEVCKGKKVNRSFIEERLLNIARISPDILEVVLLTMANPALGLMDLAKKISRKAFEVGDINVKKNG